MTTTPYYALSMSTEEIRRSLNGAKVHPSEACEGGLVTVYTPRGSVKCNVVRADDGYTLKPTPGADPAVVRRFFTA